MLVQLDELNDSLSDAVNVLTNNTGAYPADFQDTVDDAVTMMQKTQNYQEEASEEDMLEALKGSLEALQALNKDIDAYAVKLAAISVGVKKVGDTVGTVVSVLTTVVSTGII